jgi:hypothetical protein
MMASISSLRFWQFMLLHLDQAQIELPTRGIEDDGGDLS